VNENESDVFTVEEKKRVFEVEDQEGEAKDRSLIFLLRLQFINRER